MQSAPGFPVPHLPSLSRERLRFCALFANPRARPGSSEAGGQRPAWGGLGVAQREASLARRSPRVRFNRCLSCCAERARGGCFERVAHSILNCFGCKERRVSFPQMSSLFSPSPRVLAMASDCE